MREGIAGPALVSPWALPGAAGWRTLKWTRDDFYAMENLPSLQGQKSMLIDGEILVMPPPSPLSSISHSLAEEVLHARHVIAVTGTHGKTTTTAMLTWILEHAGLNPGFLVGGVH